MHHGLYCKKSLQVFVSFDIKHNIIPTLNHIFFLLCFLVLFHKNETISHLKLTRPPAANLKWPPSSHMWLPC